MPQSTQRPLPNSDRAIRSLSVEGRRVEFPDRVVKGLHLRVSKNSKTWVVLTRPKGSHRQVRVTLGSLDVMGLRDARDAAREVLLAAGRGEDPRAVRSASESGLTVLAVAREWLAEKQVRPSTYRGYRRFVERDLRPLHRLDVRTVTREDLIQLQRRIFKRAPTLSNRVLTGFKDLFRFAADVGYRPDDPAAGIRPLHKERARPRPYDQHELKTFWATTESLSPLARTFFRLRALTCCRSRTVRMMRWQDLRPHPRAAGAPAEAIGVECATAWWTIPEEFLKSGRPFEVPITPQISAVLRWWSDFTDLSGEWVFPGRGGQDPIASLSTSHRRLRAQILEQCPTFEDADFHGLRDTAATVLEHLGCPWRVVQRILDHAPQGVTARYTAHKFEDEHRRWLERWNRHLVGLAGEEEGVVVDFPER